MLSRSWADWHKITNLEECILSSYQRIALIVYSGKISEGSNLELVKQKFGSLFPASLFWSQCLLGAKELKKIRPLMLDRSAEQIRKITGYFEKQSAKEIKKTL